MPDWNPAEMIGKFPRNLSYSLYKKLITDKIWAEARYEMGYRVPKNKNLMISIGSQPYVDTRLSLNSFLPANLPKQISTKLINFWLEKFKHNPILHDKIEFDLAITCYSFDIKSKLKKLVGNTLNNIEKKIYIEDLKNLTARFFDANSNFSIEKTLKKIDKLEDSQKKFKNLGQLNQLNNLIKECKIYGTLPFSILARHGFVGITLLNSLRELKILTQRDVNLFLKSIKTVATEMVIDLNKIKKNSFGRKKISLKIWTFKTRNLRHNVKKL